MARSTDAQLLELIGDLLGMQELAELRDGLLVTLDRAVPSDFVSINEIGPSPADTYSIIQPAVPGRLHAIWAEHGHENPLIERFARTRDTRPCRFSQLSGKSTPPSSCRSRSAPAFAGRRTGSCGRRQCAVRLRTMGLQRRIALVVVAMILGVAALPSGAQAFGKNGGTETGKVTVPAGGTGEIQTDSLPPKVTQGTIEMQAQTEATTNALLDVVFALAEIPTPGKRFVACAMMTYGKSPAKEVVNLTQDDPSLQLLFFAICIHIAQALTLPSSPAADMARTTGPSCSEQRTAVPIKITRSGSGYQGVVNGSTFTPRTPSKVIITCRRNGSGLLITVKPRRRGQTLRQAVGPTLGVGFANLGTKPAPIRTTFTVK